MPNEKGIDMTHGALIADIHYGPSCAVRSCCRQAESGRCYCAPCAESVGTNPQVLKRNDGAAARYAVATR